MKAFAHVSKMRHATNVPSRALNVLMLLLVFGAEDANADVFLPVLICKDFKFALIIFPIILIEFVVMKRRILDQKPLDLLRAVTVSNLGSTILGYPLMVLTSGFLGIIFVAVYASVVHDPTIKPTWVGWTIGTAYVVITMALAFYWSYLIERRVTVNQFSEGTPCFCKLLKDYSSLLSAQQRAKISKSVLYANLASYAFLVAVSVAIELHCYLTGKPGIWALYSLGS